MITPKRILVPIDMSEHSLYALQYAMDFTKSFGSEIIVMNAIEEGEAASEQPDAAAGRSLETKRREAVVKLLIEKKMLGQNLSIRTHRGSPAREIVRAAQQAEADMIIMCTHGRSGLSHIILGSVAEKVVRFAPCAVLTVKPKDFSETAAAHAHETEELMEMA